MDNSYIGKRVDNRYDVISLIGVGGMSNVYKAIDTATGNTVAIKFLKQEFFENEEIVEEILEEVLLEEETSIEGKVLDQ